MVNEVELKRLDDMEFEEISERYSDIFEKIIGEKKFKETSKSNASKYERMKIAIGKGFKFKGGAMGRADLQFGRTMLYGWFLEELMLSVIGKNPYVKTVNFWGKDKEHDFRVENEKIVILGKKSTEPDYIICLTDAKKMFLELKSAAKGIYTIKRGNVKNLVRSFVNHSIHTAIMMLDLNEGKYTIRDIDFFWGKEPFANQRMEGQLCYEFPEPDKSISAFPKENLTKFAILDEVKMKTDPYWRKYILFKKAKENKLKELEKTISDKIKIEDLEIKKKLQLKEFKEKIDKARTKNKDVHQSWEDIEKKLRNT